MVLGLETDFDDFHGGDDEAGFGDTCAESGEEDASGVGFAGFGVCEEGFVEFEGGEADCHFGDDARYNGYAMLTLKEMKNEGELWSTSETLVKGEKAFFSNDAGTNLNKVLWFYL